MSPLPSLEYAYFTKCFKGIFLVQANERMIKYLTTCLSDVTIMTCVIIRFLSRNLQENGRILSLTHSRASEGVALFSLEQWFSMCGVVNSPQPPAQGHLATSGDIFVGKDQEAGGIMGMVAGISGVSRLRYPTSRAKTTVLASLSHD